eukprot:163558-Alexandrium_andersonii.AAC.1
MALGLLLGQGACVDSTPHGPKFAQRGVHRPCKSTQAARAWWLPNSSGSLLPGCTRKGVSNAKGVWDHGHRSGQACR